MKTADQHYLEGNSCRVKYLSNELSDKNKIPFTVNADNKENLKDYCKFVEFFLFFEWLSLHLKTFKMKGILTQNSAVSYSINLTIKNTFSRQRIDEMVSGLFRY